MIVKANHLNLTKAHKVSSLVFSVLIFFSLNLAFAGSRCNEGSSRVLSPAMVSTYSLGESIPFEWYLNKHRDKVKLTLTYLDINGSIKSPVIELEDDGIFDSPDCSYEWKIPCEVAGPISWKVETFNKTLGGYSSAKESYEGRINVRLNIYAKAYDEVHCEPGTYKHKVNEDFSYLNYELVWLSFPGGLELHRGNTYEVSYSTAGNHIYQTKWVPKTPADACDGVISYAAWYGVTILDDYAKLKPLVILQDEDPMFGFCETPGANHPLDITTSQNLINQMNSDYSIGPPQVSVQVENHSQAHWGPEDRIYVDPANNEVQKVCVEMMKWEQAMVWDNIEKKGRFYLKKNFNVPQHIPAGIPESGVLCEITLQKYKVCRTNCKIAGVEIEYLRDSLNAHPGLSNIHSDSNCEIGEVLPVVHGVSLDLGPVEFTGSPSAWSVSWSPAPELNNLTDLNPVILVDTGNFDEYGGKANTFYAEYTYLPTGETFSWCSRLVLGQVVDSLIGDVNDKEAGQPINDLVLDLYPNPGSYGFNLKSNQSIEAVLVYDLGGRLVMDQALNGTETFIDMSGHASGIYIIGVITQNGDVKQFKWVKP